VRFIGWVRAAPHPPAGTFSPYRNGEKDDGRNAGVLFATLKIGETVDDGAFLPVTIRGEMSGRTMRGGADVTKRMLLLP
jgi:hypothetical protein